MASSIHIQKASGGAVAHNSRESFSHSVVFPDEKNEILNNSKQAFALYREELAIRSQAYSERTGQSLQKNAITHLSAVVNLEQHHTLKDLETIKKEIEEKFDTKVFQIAVHRDEGKLVSKEDDKLVYTSGQDFFKCPKTNELFWDKKFTKKVDMSQYDIVKNYHAHIEFLGLDSRGEAIKRNYMSKYNLSQLQTFVAKELKMERGKNYYETKEKAPKRLDVLEFKRANTSKRENTQELVKVLEDKYKKEREELKASGAATQKDYQALKLEFEKQKKELESAKSSVETYKKLYESTDKLADTYKKRYVAEKEKAPVVTEKEKIVEKVVTVQDKARIEELEMALKSTNAKLEDVESSNRILALEMSVIAPKQEKEGFFVYARRIFYELKDKITALTAKISVLEKENAELKIANKNAIKAEMDKLVANPKVASVLSKAKEKEPIVSEKEKELTQADKDFERMQRREEYKAQLKEHQANKPKVYTLVEIDAELERQSEYTKEEARARWWGDGDDMRRKRLDALEKELRQTAKEWSEKEEELKNQIAQNSLGGVKSPERIAEEMRYLKQSYGKTEDQGMSR